MTCKKIQGVAPLQRADQPAQLPLTSAWQSALEFHQGLHILRTYYQLWLSGGIQFTLASRFVWCHIKHFKDIASPIFLTTRIENGIGHWPDYFFHSVSRKIVWEWDHWLQEYSWQACNYSNRWETHTKPQRINLVLYNTQRTGHYCVILVLEQSFDTMGPTIDKLNWTWVAHLLQMYRNVIHQCQAAYSSTNQISVVLHN